MHLWDICIFYLEKGLLIQMLCPFLCLFIINCRSSLHSLHTSPFSDIWYASIFSYSVGSPFTVLWHHTKHECIFWNHIICFLWNACYFDIISKKSLSNQRSWKSTPFFSSKGVVVLSLIVRSILISFLYLVWRSGLTSFFSMWICSCFGTIC